MTLASIKAAFRDAVFDYHTVAWLIAEVERLSLIGDELFVPLDDAIRIVQESAPAREVSAPVDGVMERSVRIAVDRGDYGINTVNVRYLLSLLDADRAERDGLRETVSGLRAERGRLDVKALKKDICIAIAQWGARSVMGALQNPLSTVVCDVITKAAAESAQEAPE